MPVVRHASGKSLAQDVAFKLKQASAILGLPKKELQNFVQFGVVRPQRRGGLYLFDIQSLYEAEISAALKTALGMSTPRLAQFIRAFSRSVRPRRGNRKGVIFRVRSSGRNINVEVAVRVARLDLKIKQAVGLVHLAADRSRLREYHVAKRATTKVTASIVRSAR
jgi:hypothetical protein